MARAAAQQQREVLQELEALAEEASQVAAGASTAAAAGVPRALLPAELGTMGQQAGLALQVTLPEPGQASGEPSPAATLTPDPRFEVPLLEDFLVHGTPRRGPFA